MGNEKGPSQAKIMIQQAKSYASLAWLGILIFPLCFIFGAMAKTKVRAATELYKLSDEEKKLAQEASYNARWVMIVLPLLYLLFFIILGSSIR